MACRASELNNKQSKTISTAPKPRLGTPRYVLSSVGVQPVASGPLAYSAQWHQALLRLLRLPRTASHGLKLGVCELLARGRIRWRRLRLSSDLSEAHVEFCSTCANFDPTCPSLKRLLELL